MSSPYSDLRPRAYWKTGVEQRGSIAESDLFRPRFKINRKQKIVTAGSCFAQHIGRVLKREKFNVVDVEPGPRVARDLLQSYGYGIYSGRYGNIYSARQMLQLLREVFEDLTPAHPIWEKDGRYYDAFRPSVEPKGLETPEDVIAHRKSHLAALRKLFSDLDVFIFTFGLTESWVAKSDGTVYPTAPGTIAGSYDPDIFEFVNFRYNDVLSDFRKVRDIIRKYNPKAKFIVTVSPVPLTATAARQHVEVASCYSKSVLRAVCGALYETHVYMDYFPSYEVITTQTAHGENFLSNYRTVRPEGVDRAMGLFLHGYNITPRKIVTPPDDPVRATAADDAADDLVCEDALLDAFAK